MRLLPVNWEAYTALLVSVGSSHWDMGLAERSGVVQLSPHHFGKLFKQSIGVSPHQYVLGCRIERAKILLADNQLSLTEISQALGFCDQSHFTNVFGRYTTLTPRPYRNRL